MAPVTRSRRINHVFSRQHHSRHILNRPVLGQLNGNQLQRLERDNDGIFKLLKRPGAQTPSWNNNSLQVQTPLSSLRLYLIDRFILGCEWKACNPICFGDPMATKIAFSNPSQNYGFWDAKLFEPVPRQKFLSVYNICPPQLSYFPKWYHKNKLWKCSW